MIEIYDSHKSFSLGKRICIQIYIFSLAAEYVYHGFAFCWLVDELVEVADLSHSRVRHVLDLHAVDLSYDQHPLRVERSLSEKCFEVCRFVKIALQLLRCLSGEPVDDLIDFAFTAICLVVLAM